MVNKTPARASTARLREELAALKQRVLRLERAIAPSQRQTGTLARSAPDQHRHALTPDARSAAISAYHDRTYRAFLRRNPGVVRRLEEDRVKLNEYLRKKGFEPEPPRTGDHEA